VALSAQRRRTRRLALLARLAATPFRSGARPSRESALDLDKAVAALPPRAREVFVLHDVYGYDHTELAQLLGIAIGTSKAHLHRARCALREVLEP
jgi:RNA polymerase sigma-70 factor (ECF subfamily)